MSYTGLLNLVDEVTKLHTVPLSKWIAKISCSSSGGITWIRSKLYMMFGQTIKIVTTAYLLDAVGHLLKIYPIQIVSVPCHNFTLTACFQNLKMLLQCEGTCLFSLAGLSQGRSMTCQFCPRQSHNTSSIITLKRLEWSRR